MNTDTDALIAALLLLGETRDNICKNFVSEQSFNRRRATDVELHRIGNRLDSERRGYDDLLEGFPHLQANPEFRQSFGYVLRAAGIVFGRVEYSATKGSVWKYGGIEDFDFPPGTWSVEDAK